MPLLTVSECDLNRTVACSIYEAFGACDGRGPVPE